MWHVQSWWRVTVVPGCALTSVPVETTLTWRHRSTHFNIVGQINNSWTEKIQTTAVFLVGEGFRSVVALLRSNLNRIILGT